MKAQSKIQPEEVSSPSRRVLKSWKPSTNRNRHNMLPRADENGRISDMLNFWSFVVLIFEDVVLIEG